MQSEECRHIAGIVESDACRYGVFQLAGLLAAPAWRNGLSLAFPPSDVAALEGRAITPACLGLLGMAGTLPYHYTEAIARAGGAAAREFMDLLSAPAVDCFCSAWRAGRPEYTPLPALPPGRGPFRARVLGERFAQALGVPVLIEQFAGRWENLPPAQASALGGGNACCGAGALLGERLWRIDSAVRILVGPLDGRVAREFLPGGVRAKLLAQLWRGAGDGRLQAEVRIRRRHSDGEGARLAAGQPGGARLGYDATLSARATGERDDLRYRV